MGRLDSSYLQQVLQNAGVDISWSQLQRLETYVDALLDTNKRINLISRKDESNIWRNHILQSLTLLTVTNPNPHWNYLDFGTGGGLPGIPLAILLPQARFILCDSIKKKIDAVKEFVSLLELNNVLCINARAEELDKYYNNYFDAVLARAVTKLDILVRHSISFIKPVGFLFAWKGGDISEEMHRTLLLSSVRNVESLPIHLAKEPYFERENKYIVRVTIK